MKHILLIGLVALTKAAPQYSGQTQDLSGTQLDTIKDIFGAEAGDGYSEQQSGKLNEGTNGVEVIVQVVKNEDGYIAPDDYQTTNSDLTDKATSTVDNVFENCADYTASQGYECVPYYQCHNGSIITDGGGLIDIRNGFGILSPEDSKCPGFLDVCCLDPDFIPPPPPPVVKHIPKCGQRHQNGLGVRIQGFSEYESQFGEWPHMCAVLAEEPVAQAAGYAGEPETVNLYQCGGSLIAPGVILTAAHCAAKFQQEPQKLKIRCGEWDTQNQNEPREHQDRYVNAIDVHPDFNPRNLANDWTLLYTTQDFELQEHIDTVCLPQPEELFDYQSCFATGWGKDQFGASGQYQVVLKEVELPVVGHDQCQNDLRKTRLGSRFKLDNSFICAGGEGGKDTCKGDGGSPLVCPSKYDPNSYVQAGIVAWGIGCGEDNTPGVYASVSKGVCWIDYAMSCRNGQQSGSYSSYWGYSAQQCQTWMDGELSRLNQEVAAMQNAGSLTGRKKAAALAAGVKAQKSLNQYNQCSVFWGPRDAQPLTSGGQGYVDGGDVDISGFERTAQVPAKAAESSAVKLTAANY
jgi:secreted trypsin-like serine protease